MDPALLTSRAFWEDATPVMAGDRELAAHVLFETSGTTGAPKWIALSKQTLGVSAAAVNAHLGVMAESCWGLALPTHHVGGFGVAARAWQAGCRMAVLEGKWNSSDFRDWLDVSQVTHTSLVPTQVHDLVKYRLTAPACLKAIVVGGGHLEVTTGQAARDLGWPVLASYGMTEAGSQIATQPLERLASPYVAAPIQILPIWQTKLTDDGRLCISGPALFSGHISGNCYFPRESEWYVTSDRVELADGALTPLGRADARVKVLGELVDLEMIERELIEISAEWIAAGSVAVVAIPDERAGNVLVPAFESSIDKSLIKEILATYQQRAPGFRRLQSAVVIERFPRSELGKLRRQELLKMCVSTDDRENRKENP